jgi:2-dehydropantoate 2-reductase
MRILIVGAGAIGGCFGAYLTEAGRDVTFLVRPARAAVLSATGLRLTEPNGHVRRVRPATITAGELTTGWDLVILAVKAYGLFPALADISPAVDEGTTVLPLLNGMAHYEILTNRWTNSTVIGGFAFVSAYLQPDGGIDVGPVPPALTYGERDGRQTGRIMAVDAQLSGAGFATTLSTTIEADLWEKWQFLAAGGAVNVLVRGTAGDAMAVPGGPETVLGLLREVAAVGAACGFPPRQPAAQQARAILTKDGSSFTASLAKDLFAGRLTEHQQIFADLVERGDRHQVPVPLLRAALAAAGVAARTAK